MGRATFIYSVNKSLFHRFQSTPSVGRATVYTLYRDCLIDISIHALRGEGDHSSGGIKIRESYISIHALRGEGDLFVFFFSFLLSYFNPRPPWGGRHFRPVPSFRAWTFQSTPSVGRATCTWSRSRGLSYISIHALRGEGDS